MNEQTIPYLGLAVNVTLAATLSGLVRSVYDTPFQYAKVRAQTFQKWRLKDVFIGSTVNIPLIASSVPVYFILFNTFKEKTTWMDTPFGQFNAGGLSVCISQWMIQPLDVIKTRIQAGTHGNMTVR